MSERKNKRIKGTYYTKKQKSPDAEKNELEVITEIMKINNYHYYVPSFYDKSGKVMERMDGTIIDLVKPIFIKESECKNEEHKIYLNKYKDVCKFVKYLFDRCLACIKFLHDNDILHNDLNMTNFMFKFSDGTSTTPRMYIKIIDFETSKYDMLEEEEKKRDISSFIFSFKSMFQTYLNISNTKIESIEQIKKYVDQLTC